MLLGLERSDFRSSTMNSTVPKLNRLNHRVNKKRSKFNIHSSSYVTYAFNQAYIQHLHVLSLFCNLILSTITKTYVYYERKKHLRTQFATGLIFLYKTSLNITDHFQYEKVKPVFLKYHLLLNMYFIFSEDITFNILL